MAAYPGRRELPGGGVAAGVVLGGAVYGFVVAAAYRGLTGA